MTNQLTEDQRRQKVVDIAKTWLKTPYHHMGRVKGQGADCLTMIAEVFIEAGEVENMDIPYYPKDWHLHRDAERYFEGLTKYTKEIKGNPQPGDVVLFKFGRCFSHGAIVIDWPLVIHAHIGRGTCYENVEQAAWLTHIGENIENKGRPRERKYFSLWSK